MKYNKLLATICFLSLLSSNLWAAGSDNVCKYKISWSTFATCGGNVVTQKYMDDHEDEQTYFLSGSIGQPLAWQPEDDSQPAGEDYVVKSGFWHGVEKDKELYGIYVNNAASGGLQNGTDWANAYTSLQSAFEEFGDFYLQNGDGKDPNVFVASGTYIPGDSRTDSFKLVDGIKIYGGFPVDGGSKDSRNPSVNKTILSGNIDGTDNCYHVVTANDCDETAILDGFDIKYGNANEAPGPNSQGGGLYCFDASPTIVNCQIQDNNAVYGGGIYCGNNSIPHIIQSLIVANYAMGSGESYEGYGGGVYIDQSSEINMTNANLIGNFATNKGGGIYGEEKSEVSIANSILTYNIVDVTNLTPGTISSYGDEYAQLNIDGYEEWGEVRFSFLKGLDEISELCSISEGNIAGGELPGFIQDGSWNIIDGQKIFQPGNYHLSIDSVMINNGDNSFVPENLCEDYENNPRITSTELNRLFVDIGFDEFIDWDASGCIDLGDFAYLSQNWLNECNRGFDNDNKVDINDLSVLAYNWLEEFYILK